MESASRARLPETNQVETLLTINTDASCVSFNFRPEFVPEAISR